MKFPIQRKLNNLPIIFNEQSSDQILQTDHLNGRKML